jgi:hypothetical protein
MPLEKRAGIAFKEAVAGFIDEHARLGLPLYTWRDGKVVDYPLKRYVTILQYRANRTTKCPLAVPVTCPRW